MSDSIHLFEYIGGPAGTGKTWIARERVRAFPDRTRLTASTGIAAINLGQSEFTCTTINSLLWYYDTRSLEDAYTTGKLDRALRRIYKAGTRNIIIDEVSMMSGRQIDLICRGIDYLNENLDYEDPLGLLLIGDFCQLPPIDEKEEGFAFEGKHWSRFEPGTTILTEIKRQADENFIQALCHVRRGEGQAAVDFFKPHMEKIVDIAFEGTTIMSKNIEVDRFNELRLDRLKTEWVRFSSYRLEEQLNEWKKLPQVLDLKIDALVMILVNKTTWLDGQPEMVYVNGDLGYIRQADPDCAVIELIRTGGLVEIPYTVKENVVGLGEVERDELHTAEKNSAHFYNTGERRVPYLAKDHFSDKIIGVVRGTCEHMPIRVSYATTCHKSQGLTLDRVQLNLNPQFFSYGGMAYVALSRARTAEGLRVVVGNPQTFVNRCKTNKKVERWL